MKSPTHRDGRHSKPMGDWGTAWAFGPPRLEPKRAKPRARACALIADGNAGVCVFLGGPEGRAMRVNRQLPVWVQTCPEKSYHTHTRTHQPSGLLLLAPPGALHIDSRSGRLRWHAHTHTRHAQESSVRMNGINARESCSSAAAAAGCSSSSIPPSSWCCAADPLPVPSPSF